MRTERPLYPHMLIVLLALAGMFDAAYLSLSRLQSRSVACVVGNGCDIVQASVWSTLPPGNGIPVAFIGVAGYLVLAALGMAALQKDRLGPLSIPPVLLAVSSVGVLSSAFLMYIQFFVIGSICFWCTMSAGFQVIIWLAALYDWRTWRTATATTSAAHSAPAQPAGGRARTGTGTSARRKQTGRKTP